MGLRRVFSALAIAGACSLNLSCVRAASDGGLPDETENEPVAAVADAQTMAVQISQIGMTEPWYTASELSHVLDAYQNIDPTGLIPKSALNPALAYYHANLSRLSNTHALTVVDFSIHSAQPRMFVINMSTGAVWALHVAHGKNSDPSNSGYATLFSNAIGSEKSSLGYYRTAETYTGSHGYSLRMDGLSSTNSNVRAREIVVHGSNYVSDRNLRAGRSWGCFAVPMNDRDRLISLIKGGSLIYAAHP